MSMRKICLLVLVCSLGMTAAFAKGKQEVVTPKAPVGLNNQSGNGAGNFTFGAVLNDENYSKLPLQTQVEGPFSSGTRGQANAPLPRSFSLKEFAPIPGDQGNVGSCAGWAAAYAAKTIMESIMLERTNKILTTKNAYSALYCYNKAREIDQWSDSSEGADPITVVTLMSEFGVPKNLDYIRFNNSFDDSKSGIPSGPGQDNMKKITIRGITRLIHHKGLSTETMQERVNKIKNNIRLGNPVIVGLFPDNSLKTAGEQWKPDRNAALNPRNAHAVTVIGYDDNKFGGAFEIINSWSEYWANGGYTWIDYETFDKFLIQASVIIDDISSYEKPFEWTNGITVQTQENNRNVPVRFLEDGVYTSRTSLKTGTKLRFVIDGNNRIDNGPVYPYIFYTDKTLGKTVQVWPPSGNASTVKIEYGKPITIPSGNQWITTDSAVKAENFMFLFSRKELDFTAVRSSFEKQNGSVIDRLSAAAGKDRFIQAAYGLYDFSNIKSIIDFLDMDSVMGIVFSTQYDKDGTTPLDMVKISGGSFTMGSPKSDPFYEDDERQRTVMVKDFFISSAQITVGEFREFIASANYRTTAEKNGRSIVYNKLTDNLEMKTNYNWSNPSYTQDDAYPVVHISWYDAVEYCNWRSKQEGLKPVYSISGGKVNIDNNANGYRLPTEAEWEYACRAGTTTSFNNGSNTITPVLANYVENFIFKPVPVRNYLPNRWGLYDMHGNVWEWTQDVYESTEYITIRGGSWSNKKDALRSAYRGFAEVDVSLSALGFRLVRPVN